MTSPCFKLLTQDMIITRMGVFKVGLDVFGHDGDEADVGHARPCPYRLILEGVFEQDGLLSAGADRN